MKTVTILVTGAPPGENLRDVEIESGTTTQEILDALNCRDYLLMPVNSETPYAGDEVIFPRVEDGAKLRCVPPAEVGIVS